jgi:hypothetical protein
MARIGIVYASFLAASACALAVFDLHETAPDE